MNRPLNAQWTLLAGVEETLGIVTKVIYQKRNGIEDENYVTCDV